MYCIFSLQTVFTSGFTMGIDLIKAGKRQKSRNIYWFSLSQRPFALVFHFENTLLSLERERKRVKLSPKIGSMKETLPYIGLSFNPSRLVLSCWAACFFFVQHFSIYQALLRMCPTRATRRAARTSGDAPRNIYVTYVVYAWIR